MRTGRGHARRLRQDPPSLTHRAVRARNALTCHAAVRLGLPIPDDADLAALAADATLADVVAQWRTRHGVAAPPVDVERSRSSLLLRTGWVSAITLIGLALSYGTAQ